MKMNIEMNGEVKEKFHLQTHGRWNRWGKKEITFSNLQMETC